MKLLVLSCEESSASDRNLIALAEFIGVQTVLVRVDSMTHNLERTAAEWSESSPVAAVSAELLRTVKDESWWDGWLKTRKSVLIHGLSSAAPDLSALKSIVSGTTALELPVPAGIAQFLVHRTSATHRTPVAGLSWSAQSEQLTAFSAPSVGSRIEAQISVNGHPLCATLNRCGTTIWLLAKMPWPDMDRKLDRAGTLRPWYAPLVAGSLFLQSSFGTFCWRRPSTSATLVIDDPYLRERYGFVRYRTLLDHLKRTGSALTVAFIPYNHRRTDIDIARLLLRNSQRFSLAVHGCDHTQGEFASRNSAWLRDRIACALSRMASHALETGMAFDKIMVFPQGLFSTRAIAALKTSAFEAALNTTPWPDDDPQPGLAVRDVLGVAITRFDCFPIFTRRYPRDIFDYAFDALYNKPIIVVEHHELFRNGYGQLVDLAQRISGLDCGVCWMPLGQAIAAACILRQTDRNRYTLRHFTPTLRFSNPFADDIYLTLEKPDACDSVLGVSVNGEDTPFSFDTGFVRYQTRLAAGQELRASIGYRLQGATPLRVSRRHRAAVAVRRALCDLRDNHISRSKPLLTASRSVTRLLSGLSAGRR